MRPDTGVCAKDDWVAIDDAELDRVGLGGRMTPGGTTPGLAPDEICLARDGGADVDWSIVLPPTDNRCDRDCGVSWNTVPSSPGPKLR